MSENLNIIGLNIDEAKKKLSLYNYTLRIVEIDGEKLLVNKNFNRKRCNVVVQNNSIIKISSFG